MHDQAWRSAALTLFYGDKRWDKTSARGVIERLEETADIATWDDARKSQVLISLLKGRAQAWKDCLEIWRSILKIGMMSRPIFCDLQPDMPHKDGVHQVPLQKPDIGRSHLQLPFME
jgi:hypothetical protein